ncbi:MAG: hypothetical protein ACD_12C00182G0002 [uncultured bacterium]|nr:MAG: hypothetical protein ACD_12C00182G0002 [uncultured bacterium]
MLKITYYVHGTTTDNENNIVTGQQPGELSDLGIKQCNELAEIVKDRQYDAVFSSDLKRAVDSAKIAFGKRYEIISDKRLREIDYGDYTGKNDSFKNNLTDYITAPFPNGESYNDVQNRIADFLKDVAAKYEGKHIAIVAHQAPQLALEILCNRKTMKQAIAMDWRKTKAWQAGWEYSNNGHAKTISEQLFEEYLITNNYKWEYEPPINNCSKKPDYLIIIGDLEIQAEVKQFDTDPLLEKALRMPSKNKSEVRKSIGGTIDPYKPIREKINQARDKFKEFKNYPCILVLYNNCFQHLDNLTIAGAMYGDLAYSLSVPRNTTKRPKLDGMFFSKRGKIRLQLKNSETIQNRTISAIVVIEKKFPEDVIRLRVIHNYFASKPITPVNIFSEKFDEHYVSKENGNLLKLER